MVGLVRHHGLSPWRLTESHQVLAYSYEVAGDAVTLGIYDPNSPDHDGMCVTIGRAGTNQSTGEALHGVISLA
jgi:hypothetical protein